MVPCPSLPKSAPKQHLVFAGITNVTNRQADKQTHSPTHTDRPRYSICGNSPHLLQHMLCGLNYNLLCVIQLTDTTRCAAYEKIFNHWLNAILTKDDNAVHSSMWTSNSMHYILKTTRAHSTQSWHPDTEQFSTVIQTYILLQKENYCMTS